MDDFEPVFDFTGSVKDREDRLAFQQAGLDAATLGFIEAAAVAAHAGEDSIAAAMRAQAGY